MKETTTTETDLKTHCPTGAAGVAGTSEKDVKTCDPHGSTDAEASSEKDLKTHDSTGSTGAMAISEKDLKTLNQIVGSTGVTVARETHVKTPDGAASTGVEVQSAVPRVITDAEAPIADKAIQVAMIGAHETPRGPVTAKNSGYRQATVEGGSTTVATDILATEVGVLSPVPLRRQGRVPGAMSTPGAFDVPGPDVPDTNNGGNGVEELASNGGMVEPATAATPANAGLAVAAPVGDPDDLEDARPVELEDQQAKLLERKKQTQFWITIGALTVIALVILMIIFVVSQNENDDYGTTNSTMASGTSAPKQPSEVLMPLLPQHTLDKLQYNSTPQSMAFEWIIQDPNFGSYSDKRLQQRFALATFYYSTHGEEWGPSWLDRNKHECQWEYFMPSGEQYEVLWVRYSELKFIDGPCVPVGVVFDNSTVVTATSILEHDDYLYLAFAAQPLTGDLPPEITMLTNLKMIQLEATGLVGTIPTILGEFSGLIALHLEMTLMTGTIPTELAQLTELRTLVITANEGITGYLPTEIGLLSNLETLDIMETNVTGPIPFEYCFLDLYDFQLTQNNLNGHIPSELGLMTRVDWLGLQRNEFVSMSGLAVALEPLLASPDSCFAFEPPPNSPQTGTLPTEVGNMRNIWILYLHQNFFTGTIPTEFSNFEGVEQFYVSSNRLTGTYVLFSFAVIVWLVIRRTHILLMPSSIPTELAKLSDSLWRLRLDDNKLVSIVVTLHALLVQANAPLFDSGKCKTGTLPTELGTLSFCHRMATWNNLLTGTIPSEIAGLTSVGLFAAYGNQFSGTLPSEFFSNTLMAEFLVQGNMLSGSIASEIGKWSSLVELQLDGNFLMTGTVPTEVGLLEELAKLRLGGNPFSGPLPSEIGALSALEELAINSTDLTGTIPVEIGRLVTNGSLTLLNLTGSPGLTGTIPDEVCGQYADPGKGYVLDFDCGPLCGCFSCPCHNASASNVIFIIPFNESAAEMRAASP
jgi:Leucine-rich repeat (LRR) protein